jgi:hypothetical protein
VQGKTERVKASDLVSLLQEFHRDKAALRERHIAGAQRVAHYDFNNTYQYVINREDTQVAWLRTVLSELGAPAENGVGAVSLPPDGKGESAQLALIKDDVLQVERFLEKWRGRVETVGNARHRKMLDVILGETVEHRRFFEQMLGGRDDLLGRRTSGKSTGGGVLPVRWLKQ